MPISEEILQRIRDNDPTLTSLDLGGNEIGDEGARVLAAALETNRILTNLILNLASIRAQGVQALATALKINTTLKSLDLGWNEIGDAGAQALATALQTNKTLTSIRLDLTGIGAQGVQALATALKQNTTLKSFDLGWGIIEDAVAQALATAFETNITLTNLYAPGPLLENKTLSSLVQRNRALPVQICEKIYQSFIQRNQATLQDGSPDSGSIVLTELESKLIDVSPRSCLEILTNFLSREDVRGTDPEILFNHIKEFPGGFRMMISSSIHSKEVFDGLGLGIRKFDLTDLFAIKGVVKDLPNSRSYKEPNASDPEIDESKQPTLAKLPEDVLGKILTFLKIDDIDKPKPQGVSRREGNQTQEPERLDGCLPTMRRNIP